MATKPTTLPTWNSGGANNVEPTSGEKAAGWAVDDVPPSSTFNWLQKLTGEWAAYLDDGDFTGGITVDGGAVVTGGLEATGPGGGPGLKGTGGTGDGGYGVEGYGSAGGGHGGYFEASFNAYAAVFGIGTAGGCAGVQGIGNATAGVVASNDAGTSAVAIDSQGRIDLDNSTAPSSTTALKNEITRNTIVKAIALISPNGTGTITPVFAQSITSVAQDVAGVVTITLAQAFSGSNWHAIAFTPSGLYNIKVTRTGSTAATLEYADHGSVTFNKTRADLNGVALTLVLFYGEQ